MIVHDRKWSKRAKPEVVFFGLTFRARLRSTTMAPFERAWASFAVKVLSDCPYLSPFPRYWRRNFDYVMPKKSSYENVQLAKNSRFMGNVNSYHVSEVELRKYVNEYRGPRQISGLRKFSTQNLNAHISRPEVKIDTIQKPFLSARRTLKDR